MAKRDITNSPKIQEWEIESLKQLFPQFFIEWNFDIEGFKNYLDWQTTDNNEFYRFEWTGKKNAKCIASKPTKNTLLPDKENSKNWDTTENLFIEWDNLEVLKLLLNKYYGQIKMIYIDPPYNKDKDFVYKDTWKDNLEDYLAQTGQVDENGETTTEKETTGRKHSNWLNMIYPRLILARKLLKEDGVIFVSIDDDEVHNLRKVMDEVFWEDNFIWQFVLNSTPNGKDYWHIAKQHEYCIFYCKNMFEANTFLLEEKEKKFTYSDDKWWYNIHPLYNSNEAFTPENRPNLYYPFYLNPNNNIRESFYEISLEKKEWYIQIYPPLSVRNWIQFVWRWWKTKSLENLNIEIIWYKTWSWEYRIVEKMRHSSKLIRSLLLDKWFSTRRWTAEVEEIFWKKVFSFPKTKLLLESIIKVSLDKNDVILDFFAGSWTTAHAVMDLNKDWWNRKFICVQLPEKVTKNSEAEKAWYKTISEITRTRIDKAWEKIKNEKWWENVDIWFRAFKLAESNFKYLSEKYEINENTSVEQLELLMKKEVEESGLIEWRNEIDVIYELIIREWYSFYSNIEKQESGIYKVSDENKYFYALIQEKLSEENVRNFVKNHLEEKQVRFFALEESLEESARATLDTYFTLYNI